MQKDEYNLRPIWDELLRLYEVVRNICERHKLRYYANAGTAIGAIRHKGFIPWDDDLDLYMPRSDYEKFLEIADAELPSYLKQLTWKNSPTYDQMFCKIMETRPEVVDKAAVESNLPLAQGLFVDIFPLDGVPVSKLARAFFTLQSRIAGIYIDCAYRNLVPTGLRGVAKRLVAWIWQAFHPKIDNRKKMMAWAESVFRKIDFDKSRYCETYWFFGRDDRYYETNWFSQMKFVPFDKTTIPVPIEYEKYLTCRFGNWQELPPDELRHPTHSNRVRPAWRLGPEE